MRKLTLRNDQHVLLMKSDGPLKELGSIQTPAEP